MASMGSDDPMADLNLVVELGFALGNHGNDPMEKKKLRPADTTMAISVSIVAIITSLHLIAFVFAVGAERRRSTAKVLPDQYDEKTYCVYAIDASTVYGLTAFGLLLLSQSVLNGVTKCLCFGKGLVSGSSTTSCLLLNRFLVNLISNLIESSLFTKLPLVIVYNFEVFSLCLIGVN